VEDRPRTEARCEREPDHTVLCRAVDVPESAPLAVRLGRRELVVARTPRGIRAVRGVCPHQGAPMAGGVLCGVMLPGRAGDYVFGRSGEFIRCPWHGWEFELESGRSRHDPDGARIAIYDVVVCGEHVCLRAVRADSAAPE
jgi:3-phenylpropionate/trans-cinnamate dioxygenase ferredoxin subunit